FSTHGVAFGGIAMDNREPRQRVGNALGSRLPTAFHYCTILAHFWLIFGGVEKLADSANYDS
ncbi:MAG: hypothetical protein ACK52W_02375, partial [Alphaproteobacteria bacterium]